MSYMGEDTFASCFLIWMSFFLPLPDCLGWNLQCRCCIELVRMIIFVLFLIPEGRFQSFINKYNWSCRFVLPVLNLHFWEQIPHQNLENTFTLWEAVVVFPCMGTAQLKSVFIKHGIICDLATCYFELVIHTLRINSQKNHCILVDLVKLLSNISSQQGKKV